jgi:hypothetical protein
MQIVNYFYRLHKANAFRTGFNEKLRGRETRSEKMLKNDKAGLRSAVKNTHGFSRSLSSVLFAFKR